MPQLLPCPRNPPDMLEIARTNDIVLISVIEAVFSGEGISYLIADQFMSVLEGSTGFMQRRIMVDPSQIDYARQILRESGLMAELQNG